MTKPLPLKEEEIKALEHRMIQGWQVHRADMEALFEMARGYNAFVAGGALLPQPAPVQQPVQLPSGYYNWMAHGTGVPVP